MIKAILTDIEGTTSSLEYVKEVMFPYSKAKLKNFILKHADDEPIKKILQGLSEKFGKKIEKEEAIKIFESWIDQDMKEPLLKELQGYIWEEGFLKGELKGHIYKDAYEKLIEWKNKGLLLYVFSSGSVKAQKLFFGHTEYGDLTPLFSGFFDTKIGSKKDHNSYKKISEQIGIETSNILFLSDVEEELDSAKIAGIQTMKVERYQSEKSKHKVVKDFYSIAF
ncbi:MAG: acireductone synthase [Candidatus Calescibacterium sp.]|nr:acireductone synthase [Candidatus Calescibacterium sp.]MDW8086456.1 acireductone synthase [Candidatus Calescibacterium sp.]